MTETGTYILAIEILIRLLQITILYKFVRKLPVEIVINSGFPAHIYLFIVAIKTLEKH